MGGQGSQGGRGPRELRAGEARFTREESQSRPDLRAAWEAQAEAWTRWAREPGHDSYWRFGRDAFFALLPPPGKLTLDLGCGEGRVSRDLAVLGHRVLAMDASRSAVAAAAAAATEIPAVVADAGALPVRDGSCDLVVAYMVLQDFDDMERAVAESARALSPGGTFAVAIVHPLNSAGAFTGLEPDAPFVIEGSYLDSRPYVDRVERDGLAIAFHSHHHPLERYFGALESCGLVVEALREVPEDEASAKAAPRRLRWRRLPLFLHLRAVKRLG